MNSVQLIGNLTRDPEVRYTASGMAICELGIAHSRKFKDKEETTFVAVTVWDKQAENCAQYLSKGKKVAIEGRLTFSEWQNKDSGKKRTKLIVTANNVQFLTPKTSGETPPPAANPGDDENLPF